MPEMVILESKGLIRPDLTSRGFSLLARCGTPGTLK